MPLSPREQRPQQGTPVALPSALGQVRFKLSAPKKQVFLSCTPSLPGSMVPPHAGGCFGPGLRVRRPELQADLHFLLIILFVLNQIHLKTALAPLRLPDSVPHGAPSVCVLGLPNPSRGPRADLPARCGVLAQAVYSPEGGRKGRNLRGSLFAPDTAAESLETLVFAVFINCWPLSPPRQAEGFPPFLTQ